jgi:hypothetical protein
MNEDELLDDIFGDSKKWKEKYKIFWCDLCRTYSIACPEENCVGASCNSGGCDKCKNDMADFDKAKTSPCHYLSDEENAVIHKFYCLKKIIKESLKHGDYTIDWQKLETLGELSKADHILFPAETKNLIPYKNI